MFERGTHLLQSSVTRQLRETTDGFLKFLSPSRTGNVRYVLRVRTRLYTRIKIPCRNVTANGVTAKSSNIEISSARCRQRYSRVGIVSVGRKARLRALSQHCDVASYHSFAFVIPLETFGRSYFFARRNPIKPDPSRYAEPLLP
jgi:hypothetical protein